jgi:serine/threonine protein kinase
MQPNFFVPWSTCMASTWCIGMCELKDVEVVLLTLNHSDLKPENILLDYTGHIALCDFGQLSAILINLWVLILFSRTLQIEHVRNRKDEQ